MNKCMSRIFITAAFALVSSQAFAWCANGYYEVDIPGNSDAAYCVTNGKPAPTPPTAGTTNTNTNGNTNTNNNNANANAAANANAVANGGAGGQGGKGGDGGNATGGTANSTNNNTVTGTNRQNQHQNQAQQQQQTQSNTSTNTNTLNNGSNSSSGVSNSGNSSSAVSDSGNSNVANAGNNVGNSSNDIRIDASQNTKEAVRTAYAPTIITGSDQCLVPISAGGQGFTFGFTVGGAYRDEICEQIKLSRELQTMGHARAAMFLLAQDSRVKQALEDSGETLTKKVATAKIAVMSVAPAQHLASNESYGTTLVNWTKVKPTFQSGSMFGPNVDMTP